MSGALGVADELIALAILYPGLVQKAENTHPNIVEVRNRVYSIIYKIALILANYPAEAPRIELSEVLGAPTEIVKKIEELANEEAKSRVGELMLCDIVDFVQNQFAAIDKAKDEMSRCEGQSCSSCSKSVNCVEELLESVTDEDAQETVAAGFGPFGIQNYELQNSGQNITQHLSVEEAQRVGIKQSIQSKEGLSPFDPHKEIW